jgi:hypothetical protein
MAAGAWRTESTQQIIQDVFKEKKQGSVWLLTFY